MSKTGAFFGDILHIKPIVSPYEDGVRKMGVARSTKEQVKFAFRRLEQGLMTDQRATLLLEYTDNREWLEKESNRRFEGRFPRVKVILQVMSMTSAVHMGPGTWAIAFLPDNPGRRRAMFETIVRTIKGALMGALYGIFFLGILCELFLFSRASHSEQALGQQP